MPLAVIQANIQFSDTYVSVAPGATVSIRDSETLALVAIFSDRAGVTQITNPVTADVNGFFRVYTAPGRVNIIAVSGLKTAEWKDVVLTDGAGGGDELISGTLLFNSSFDNRANANCVAKGIGFNAVFSGTSLVKADAAGLNALYAGFVARPQTGEDESYIPESTAFVVYRDNAQKQALFEVGYSVNNSEPTAAFNVDWLHVVGDMGTTNGIILYEAGVPGPYDYYKLLLYSYYGSGLVSQAVFSYADLSMKITGPVGDGPNTGDPAMIRFISGYDTLLASFGPKNIPGSTSYLKLSDDTFYRLASTRTIRTFVLNENVSFAMFTYTTSVVYVLNLSIGARGTVGQRVLQINSYTDSAFTQIHDSYSITAYEYVAGLAPGTVIMKVPMRVTIPLGQGQIRLKLVTADANDIVTGYVDSYCV